MGAARLSALQQKMVWKELEHTHGLYLLGSFFAAPIAVQDIVVIGGCKLMHGVCDNIPDADHMSHISKPSPLSVLLCIKVAGQKQELLRPLMLEDKSSSNIRLVSCQDI